jgi:hypothetical protein
VLTLDALVEKGEGSACDDNIYKKKGWWVGSEAEPDIGQRVRLDFRDQKILSQI